VSAYEIIAALCNQAALDGALILDRTENEYT
jgi:hypothetical protein